jgi:hypothetical protein
MAESHVVSSGRLREGAFARYLERAKSKARDDARSTFP